MSSFYLVLSVSSFIAAQNCQHPSVFYNGTKLEHSHNIEKAHTYVFKVSWMKMIVLFLMKRTLAKVLIKLEASH